MAEHRIRLRGAWDRTETGAARGGPNPVRVDLPTVWSELDTLQPFCLIRRFGRPRSDPNTGAVRLELSDVPGLRAARLNGAKLDLESLQEPGGMVRIALGDRLLSRNTLELDVDPSGLGRAERADLWGTIALVIGIGDVPI